MNPIKRKMVYKCGDRVCFGINADMVGWENVFIGNDVSIGKNYNFMTTKAKIYRESCYVRIICPHNNIITGNHIFYVPGKYRLEIKEADKREKDDQDVVLKWDNWVGCNARILKGLTIGYGAIIAAVAVATKDVEEYCIVGENPAKVIKKRFSDYMIEKIKNDMSWENKLLEILQALKHHFE